MGMIQLGSLIVAAPPDQGRFWAISNWGEGEILMIGVVGRTGRTAVVGGGIAG